MTLAQRAAFEQGASWRTNIGPYTPGQARTFASPEAARRYPLPRVTRPRVVREASKRFGDIEWKYEHGALWHRFVPDTQWRKLDSENSGMYIYPERVTLLADLIANPNETVNE